MVNEETVQAISEKIEQTEAAAEETVRHPFVKRLAQFGFYTKGFLFIVIGVLAISLAVGLQGGKLVDATGALTTIAQKISGKILLVIFIVGASGHGLWNFLRGAADVDNVGKNLKGIAIRIGHIAIALFYIGLALAAFDIVMSANVQAVNGELPKTLTAILFGLPMGAALVFIIGLSVVGAGIHQCYSGFSGKFQEHYRSWEIGENHQRFINVLGVLSFTARALLFGLVGYFFISAAIHYNPEEVIGVDGALLTLSQSYFGKILLFVTAAGLIGYGILSLYEAKYRRIC